MFSLFPVFGYFTLGMMSQVDKLPLVCVCVLKKHFNFLSHLSCCSEYIHNPSFSLLRGIEGYFLSYTDIVIVLQRLNYRTITGSLNQHYMCNVSWSPPQITNGFHVKVWVLILFYEGKCMLKLDTSHRTEIGVTCLFHNAHYQFN